MSNYTRLKAKTWQEEHGSTGKIDDRHFPSLSFSLDDLPEAANWEMNKEYKIGLKVKQTSMSKDKNGKGRVTFDIVAVNPESEEDEDDYEEDDDESEED